MSERNKPSRDPLAGVKLRPCPYCGGPIGVVWLDGGWSMTGEHRGGCILDGALTGTYGRLADLVEAINRRPPCQPN